MSLIWTDMFGEHSKIDIAIQRLKDYEKQALQYDPEGYYVTDSGGKDSAVIKQLCLDAGVKFGVYHHHTSVDHPETFYFVRREKKRFEDMGYHYEITHNYDKNGKRITMWSLIEQKSFPTRIRRFCCQQLKEGGGEGRVVVTGVDCGATNRKLGSDMGDSVTGGGLHGKDLSKADVSVNIYVWLVAQEMGHEVNTLCAIGDEDIDGVPYAHIVDVARKFIANLGGFEKFAEWGLIR